MAQTSEDRYCKEGRDPRAKVDDFAALSHQRTGKPPSTSGRFLGRRWYPSPIPSRRGDVVVTHADKTTWISRARPLRPSPVFRPAFGEGVARDRRRTLLAWSMGPPPWSSSPPREPGPTGRPLAASSAGESSASSRHHGLWARSFQPEGVGKSRADRGRHRPLGDQRGLRRSSGGLHQETRALTR